MLTKKLPSTISSKEIPIKSNHKWKPAGRTVIGENGVGRSLKQLALPQGMFIDDDEDIIYIADWWNDRIIQWRSNTNTSDIIAGGNQNDDDDIDQLHHPTDILIDKENNSLIIADCENRRVIRWSREKDTQIGEILISDIDCVGLAMDKNGSLYVSDCVNNKVIRWNRVEKNITIVAGGNGQGDHLNQLNSPTFIFIDHDYSLYISDMNNHRIMKWEKNATEGIVVAGGHGNGNRLTQLSYPEGLLIDQFGHIYIADSLNHRIMRWCKGASEGTIIVGGNGQGKRSDQLNGPIDLSFDRQENLYVVDCWNHRMQKFEIDSNENFSS